MDKQTKFTCFIWHRIDYILPRFSDYPSFHFYNLSISTLDRKHQLNKPYFIVNVIQNATFAFMCFSVLTMNTFKIQNLECFLALCAAVDELTKSRIQLSD